MDKLMKAIYLDLDEHNNVKDVTENETPYLYCEVEEEVEINSIREFLELDKYVIRYEDDCLVIVEEKIIVNHDVHIDPPPDKNQEIKDEIERINKQLQSLQTAVDNLHAMLSHEVEIDEGGDV
ncbi:hypothetical protein NHG29_01530 [Aerococcaceae bacterium NML160702]|nr:hypothetical protein [Aerococcaceae bacterium NML190073]MCW6681547.1 hypothetical protein [Aerococcaceae bacterium NML160702]